MARRPKDLLKVLANRTNRDILALLRAEPTYPRRLAELVGITEGEAQKRLKLLEEHGLVRSQWVHVGKNVKRYTLEAKALRIEVGPDGLALSLEGAPAQEPVKLAPALESVPQAAGVVGREQDLASLRRALEGKGAAALLGIAGQGKTSLAARLAREAARPVFWTTLRGTEGAPQLLSRLAVFLGAQGQAALVQSYVHLDASADLNAQVALLGEGLGRAGALVVVDDAHAARDEALRGTLGALAERAGPFQLLLVGRALPRGLPRARLAAVHLGGLGAEGTAQLLAAHGLDAGRDEAAAIHAKTGGHPLALTLLAESARGKAAPLGELAALLPGTRIEAWLWEEVFSDLTPEDRAFLGRIAVLRGPVDPALAEEVAREPRARERFFALERRHLCQPVGEGFVVHDVVRQFAGRLARPGPEVHARAARALEARGGLDDALEALRHHLEAGQEREALALVRRESEEQAYRFADMGLGEAYAALLDRLAPRLEGDERALVHLERARALQPTPGLGKAMEDLATAARLLGPRSPPRLRMLLRFLEARGAYRAGDYALAARRFGEVLPLAERARDAGLVLDALHERAMAHEDRGRMAEAEQGYRRALARARREGDLRRAALIEGGMGRVLLHLGQPEEALRHLERGLAAAGTLGHLRVEANLRRSMSEFWMFRGDPVRAAEAARGYLELARRLGDPWGVCCALVDAAWVEQRRGAWEEVERLVAEVEEVHRRVPMDFFLVQGQGLLVVAAAARGRWDLFEARASAFRMEGSVLGWHYIHLLFGELARQLHGQLREEGRGAVMRVLGRRPAGWIRAALDAWARGRPAPAAPVVGLATQVPRPRRRAAPRATESSGRTRRSTP